MSEGALSDPVVDQLISLGEELLDDSPKLDVILKNFVSIVVAKAQVGDQQAASSTLKLDEALSMARAILKAISALQLPDAAQWGALDGNAQGEAQTGEDRIEQLTRYNAARVLFTKAKANKDNKISKTFGKLFLLWTNCWNLVHQSCRNAKPASTDEEVWEECLESFGLSLRLMKVAGSAVSDMRLLANCDLLFATDFKAALGLRQARRTIEANLVDEDEDEDEEEEEEQEQDGKR